MHAYGIIRASAIALGVMAIVGQARAESNLLMIFDASNSMWGQIDGVAKIESARVVLEELVGGLPDTVQPGLMVYGHRRQGDCSDVELVVPITANSAGSIRAAVKALTPRGKTPIATALEQAWDAFSGKEEHANSVVLISDGIETCDRDPCAASAALVERGVNVKVHTVGFDVDRETRRQLECIAERGRGRYFDARNADELRQALEEAKSEVIAEASPPPTAPSETEPQVFFEDQFDGGVLGDDWTVDAPDPEALLVEDGALLLVDAGSGPAEAAGARNVVRLSRVDLPKEDFVATAELEFGIQTAREIFQLGVFDQDSFVTAELYTLGDKYKGWSLMVRVRKVANDQTSQFAQPVAKLDCNVCKDEQDLDDFAATVSQPIILQLVKEGRALFARARLAGSDAEWVETDKVSTLRLRGDLIIKLGVYEDHPGETFAAVDRVAIEIQ